MSDSTKTISFLTDYGLRDEFVGVVKSAIWSISPDTRICDITHGIARHDIRAGGLALARSVQFLNAGVVLAVVDPGVGAGRMGVAVELVEGDLVLVGPDNGLLAAATAFMGGASKVVSLTNNKYHLPAAGPTFDGRDIFGPVSAHICNGVALAELGEEVPAESLVPGLVPTAHITSERIVAEVLWIDHFGNAQLNVGPDDLADLGERFALRVDEFPVFGVVSSQRGQSTQRPQPFLRGQSAQAAQSVPKTQSHSNSASARTSGQPLLVSRMHSYDLIERNKLALVVDSYGMVSVAMRKRSAADELGLYEGSAVILEPFAGDLVAFPQTTRD